MRPLFWYPLSKQTLEIQNWRAWELVEELTLPTTTMTAYTTRSCNLPCTCLRDNKNCDYLHLRFFANWEFFQALGKYRVFHKSVFLFLAFLVWSPFVEWYTFSNERYKYFEISFFKNFSFNWLRSRYSWRLLFISWLWWIALAYISSSFSCVFIIGRAFRSSSGSRLII